MKKTVYSILSASMLVALAGCSKAASSAAPASSAASSAEAASSEVTPADVELTSYADFVAAPADTPVTVETYVQAKQGWWEDAATIYTQNEEGAYFIYSMPISEEDYNKLTEGTKIRVSGYKAEWSGELEIVDAKYEILEGNYIAPAADITDKLGTDEIINFMNQKVAFKDMEVVADDNGNAFTYNWDGSGEDGDDLYFYVANANGDKFQFTVESYLTGKGTDVYEAVKNLKAGDKIDCEGFLYWYEGINPHITSVTVK